MTGPTAPATRGDAGQSGYAPELRVFVFALFFIFGGITSLNDVIIPKLKGLFTLSYAEVMLVQSAFFAAYFIVSLPAAALLRRIGYMRTATVGLLLMTLGCLLFIPASRAGLFPLFLGALFVLAAGITTVQVVANPLISMLGSPQTTHSRLTFAQAFNSLGTTIFPYVGSMLILGGALEGQDTVALTGSALTAYRTAESAIISRTYLGLAAALLVLSALVWWQRKRLVEQPVPRQNILRAFGLLRQPRFGFGAFSIFLYVGGEVAIGSLIVNYLMQSSVMGLEARAAGTHVALYWGGAMVGRFIGAWLLQAVSPGKLRVSQAWCC
jgi:MFS transporter, FHS family, L-fucose permease